MLAAPYHPRMSLPRRSFLKSAAVGCPSLAASLSFPLEWIAEAGLAQSPSETNVPDLRIVPAGKDRLGAPHSLGFSTLAFKVLTSDTAGNLFVIEHTNLMPNTGPALHLHLSQEEWFYVMEGEVALQVGDQRVHLHAGESILAPRRIPHCFSAVGSPAHLLIAFTPADKMEQYFIDAAAHPSLAATEDFMNRYAMKWVGPSPFWKA
jgi:mannose-6-phosphate isomerase-like protein (cupin superfamily)